MTDSKPTKRRTGPAPDAPEGYEYTPASDEVHRIFGRRFDTVRPVAIDPERPGTLLYDVGNWWDGASEVTDNGDGSYSYTNPYKGRTDRFDAHGYWTSDGEYKRRDPLDASPETCEANARKGTGTGTCGRPLSQGGCDRASDHI
jgi:hypothetical protein